MQTFNKDHNGFLDRATKAIALFLAFLLCFQGVPVENLAFAAKPKKAKAQTQANRPPVLKKIPDFVFSTDIPVEFKVDATDPDGDPLTFTATDLPPDAEFKDRIFSWTPQQIHIGDYEAEFSVTDGRHIAKQKVFIFVVPGNMTLPSSLPEPDSVVAPVSDTIAPAAGKGIAAGAPKDAFLSAQVPGVTGGTPAGGGAGAPRTGGSGGRGGPVMIANGVVEPNVVPIFQPTQNTSGTGSTGGSTSGTGNTGTGNTGNTGGNTGGGTTTAPAFKFTDTTTAVGITASQNTEAVAVGDLSGDGKMDFILSQPIGAYVLYVNNGSGTFRPVTLLDLGNSFAGGIVTLGDYDNDGHLDIFIARNGGVFLLRNNGNITFSDVTAAAGVSLSAETVGASFIDYDRDGRLDLFVVTADQPSILFKNLGNGAFSNATIPAGITSGVNDENRAAVFFDVDNDDDQDLYVVNYLTANVLYSNQGNGTFVKSVNAGVADAGRGVAAAVTDFNNDGFMDLLLMNDSDTPSFFYLNNGNATFTSITTQSGLPSLGLNPRAAVFGDFNNDGFTDLYIVRNSETNMFLANDGNGKFLDQSAAVGVTLPLIARSLAVGDYDQDGRPDLFVAGNPFTIYRNETTATNGFVQIKTVGTRSNKSGIGARLDLQTGSRRALRYVTDGSSNGKESLIQTHGLGTASLSSFTIRWPSGTVQNVLSKITPNQLNVIRENAAPSVTVNGNPNVNEGEQLVLTLTATDPDNTLTAQNDQLILSAESTPQNSTFTDNGGGTGEFKFNPAFDQAGQYTVTFRVTDGDLSGTATILITVNNITNNHAPTITPLQNYTINEGESVQFDVIAQDPDNDALQFSITSPTPVPANATLTPDANNPNLVHFRFEPDFDQAGQYTFTFTVTDGALSASTQSLINVGDVNRPPVIDPIGEKTMTEGETLTFIVTASDPDGDTLSFTATGLPSNASFNPTTREFKFEPDFTQAGVYNVKFQVSDGSAVTEQTVKITVQEGVEIGPKTPTLIDPGVTSYSGKFTLQWSDESASGAILYEVQESDKADFSNIIRSILPGTNTQAINLAQSGAYFYRVRAYDGPPDQGGIASGFSNVVNILVDLERDLDFLKVFTNQGIIDGNPQQSQSNRSIVNDPEGLGSLGANGNAIQFNYDLQHQDLAGLFFENNGTPVDLTPFQTLNLRVRGDSAAGYPVKLTIEMRRGGDFSSLVLFFKVTDQYQDFTFPFFRRINEIDTMTILVEGDTQGDGLGTVFVDEFFLSKKPYLANTKPNIMANSGPAGSDEEILDSTEAQAALYFYEQIVGPGWVKDADNRNYASVAATGFGLTAMTVLANRFDSSNSNWNKVTPAQARARTEAILDAILQAQALQAQDPAHYGTNGFLYHFIHGDGTRHGSSEVSSVDHALLLLGVITAGEYFGGTIQMKADQIYMNSNFGFFLDTNGQFRRRWTPEAGLGGHYDFYTDEILLMSLLAIGTDPDNLAFLKSYYSFPRNENSYRGGSGEDFRLVNSFFGSLFTYFYAHCWFDFQKLGADKPQLVPGAPVNQSVNWWVNSIQAARANRQFAIDRSAFFPFSFHSKSWGISAVQRPDGYYEGLYGAPPHQVGAHDGTVAVHAPIATLPFFRTFNNEPLGDNQAFQVLKHYYKNYFSQLWGPYGPKESLNNEGEFSPRYLGIDVGPEVIMIENYRTRFVWETFMKNAKIKAATEKIFGTPNGEDEFTVTVKNVDNNQVPAGGKLDFGLSPGGTKVANAKQYLEIQYNLSIDSAAICIYTDNREYTGQGEGAGLIGKRDRSESVPMYWRAFDTLQSNGYNFNLDQATEAIMQDRRRGDFLNPIITNHREIVDGTGKLMPAKPNAGSDQTPVYVYFGVNYDGASAQDYDGTIVIEICHFS